MKTLILLSLALPLAAPLGSAADADLELLANDTPARVFAGAARNIPAVFCNPAGQTFAASLRTRLWQTTSATAVPLADTPWKTLRVLPGQTVLESAPLNFPAVRARTKFLVQWCAPANHLLGATEVLVYPANLLDQLKLLTDGAAANPGVLDPHDQLKPALRQAGIKFSDLADTTLADFSGRLALIGPCQPADPEWLGLTRRVARLARRGTAVVWIQPPPPPADAIRPSFYLVPETKAVVVVVEPSLVAGLADHPQAQLNLIYFCQLALQPEPFPLPELTTLAP